MKEFKLKRRSSLVISALIMACILLYAGLLYATDFVFPPESAEYISKIFSNLELKEIDQSKTLISISGKQASAELAIAGLPEKISVSLMHKSKCENPQSKNFCITINKGDRLLTDDLAQKIIGQIIKLDTDTVWRKLVSKVHENHIDKLEQKDQVSSRDLSSAANKSQLVILKTIMLYLCIVSILIICLLSIFALIKFVRGKGAKSLAPFLSWYSFALLARFLFVEPTQLNSYSSLIPQNWISQFPNYGVLLPIIEQISIYIFPDSLNAVFCFFIVIGALAVPLLFCFANLLFKNPVIAHTAAFILALSPLHIRLSASDSVHAIILTLYLIGAIAWINYNRKGDSLNLNLTFFASILIMLSRPEAIIFPLSYLAFTGTLKYINRQAVVLMLLAGVILLANGFIYYQLSAFVSAFEQQASVGSIFDIIERTFFHLLGSGNWLSNDPYYWQFVLISVFGVLPDFILGYEIWQPNQSLQWTPAILSIFLMLSIVLAIWNKWIRRLLLAILFIRLPGLISSGLSGTFSGLHFHTARYFIPMLVLQFVLIAYAINFLYNLQLKYKVKGWLLALQGAVLLCVFCLSVLKMLPFKFAYQEEADFLWENQNLIEQGANIAYLDAESSMDSMLELSSHPNEGILNLIRSDLHYTVLDARKKIGELKSDYYLELATCSIKLNSYSHYLPARENSEEWNATKKEIASFKDACNNIASSKHLELVARKWIRPVAYAGHFNVKNDFIPISLYRVKSADL